VQDEKTGRRRPPGELGQAGDGDDSALTEAEKSGTKARTEVGREKPRHRDGDGKKKKKRWVPTKKIREGEGINVSKAN